jgi:ribulose-5-phosphate 4-epimerase/fuculose-1-phosphate aldolase
MQLAAGFRFDERSAIERVRAEVLSASKQMSRVGLVASVWGNISARIPGTDLATVTPSGGRAAPLPPSDVEKLREAYLTVYGQRGLQPRA